MARTSAYELQLDEIRVVTIQGWAYKISIWGHRNGTIKQPLLETNRTHNNELIEQKR